MAIVLGPDSFLAPCGAAPGSFALLGPLASGEACTSGVLGVAAWGDMSLDAAKKAGGITTVDTIDYKVMEILGVVYAKHCTVITGR